MDAPAQQGGGMAEALVSLDNQLAKVIQAVTQNDKVPDEIKGDFAQSLQAWRSGLEKLTQFVGGGEGEAAQGGAVAPEAGANAGAVPMSPAGVRK